MLFYTKTTSQCLVELNSDATHGLAATSVRERQAKYGHNEITVKDEPLWRKILEPFANIFMFVLFIATAISLFQRSYIEASLIAAIMMVSATIYYIQRISTERILRSLQRKDAHIVDVIRDGTTHQVDASDLVPGDILLIEEGEKIPADSRLLSVSSFRVDESQLTGESLPIEKQTEELPDNKEVYEQSNMVFQGSFVVGGQATALVIATGNDTEFGKLAGLTAGASEQSPVQKKIDRLISIIIRVIGAIAVVAFSLALYRGMEFSEAIRYVLALSVSAIPESLPIATAVVLVLGMRRMARKNALVKTMRAIESVGIITVIATDKTGTLTKNKLTVQDIWNLRDKTTATDQAVLRTITQSKSKTHDPLDSAMYEYVGEQKTPETPLFTLPFDQTAAMSGNIYEKKETYELWVKGAPEKILDACALSAAAHADAYSQLHRFASNGFRVIGLAHALLKQPIESFEDLPKSVRFEFDGFIAVADILRPEAKRAINTAVRAGIQVYMITGDHFDTALHIGKELGIIERQDQVFDSRKMTAMSDNELKAAITDIRVFSRVVPENKYRILEILKKENITAMTGDGVNDVPALVSANVGVAMGSGSSIAKDAGDIILLDDNFKSIVNAVHEGRTVYANIKRMVAYLLSTNAGEVLVAFGALLLGVPVPLVAVQILWVNLVTDSSMVIPLGLEPGERHNMNVRPQAANAPLFSKFMLSRIALVAGVMAVATILIYLVSLRLFEQEYARTLAFHALVVMQWASALNYRSDYESIFRRIRRISLPFYIGLLAAITLQAMALWTPLGNLLHVAPVSLEHILIVTFIAFVFPIVIIEAHKWTGRRYFNKGHVNAEKIRRRRYRRQRKLTQPDS